MGVLLSSIGLGSETAFLFTRVSLFTHSKPLSSTPLLEPFGGGLAEIKEPCVLQKEEGGGTPLLQWLKEEVAA